MQLTGQTEQQQAAIDFKGRVVIVTGAGHGLGRAYALELSRRGARVVVNDVGCAIDGCGQSSLAADGVVMQIRSAGGEAIACCESVAHADGGRAIVQTALDAFGRVDALISNAGILSNAAFHEMRIEQIHSVISTNLLGAIYVAHPAYVAMKQQGYGRLVFTSSGAGLFGARNSANYAAAKAGLIGLSATLALEGSEFGVKSNVIAPNAATRMAAGVRPQDVNKDASRLMSATAGVALPSTPEFVTSLAVYLASEACAVSQEVFSAVRGRFARAFVGIGEGWYGPTQEPASAEDIRLHLGKIRDLAVYHLPCSVYDELVLAATGRSTAPDDSPDGRPCSDRF